MYFSVFNNCLISVEIGSLVRFFGRYIWITLLINFSFTKAFKIKNIFVTFQLLVIMICSETKCILSSFLPLRLEFPDSSQNCMDWMELEQFQNSFAFPICYFYIALLIKSFIYCFQQLIFNKKKDILQHSRKTIQWNNVKL